MIKLSTIREQMEKAKTDAVVEFKASQSFIVACTVYYENRFEDCLKQVGSVYPDLDLSKISLDDPIPTTLGGGNIVGGESDDSIHTEEQSPKDYGVIIAQPVLEGHVTTLVPSVEDPST